MGAAKPMLHEVAFRAAEDLVQGWQVGGAYLHHTQLRRETATGGVEFVVTFSKPTPSMPVPEHVANVLVTVEPPPPEAGTEDPVCSYAIESELQRHPQTHPFRLAWRVGRSQKKRPRKPLFPAMRCPELEPRPHRAHLRQPAAVVP